MKTLKDYQGRAVRLTDERLAHILEHPEMANLETALTETLEHPTLVVQSRSDGKILDGRRFRIDGVSDGPTEERRTIMADKVKVWFDAEGDFLEVRFSEAAGYMKETNHDAVMERVDEKGNVIGFSIMQVSRLAKQKPLEADLLPSLN